MVATTVLVATLRLILLLIAIVIIGKVNKIISEHLKSGISSDLEDRFFKLEEISDKTLVPFTILTDLEVFIAAIVAGLPGVRSLYRQLNHQEPDEDEDKPMVCKSSVAVEATDDV